MPYTKKTLPAGVSGLPDGAKTIWLETFNAVYGQNQDEDTARMAAWANVKKSYKKGSDGKWVQKD